MRPTGIRHFSDFFTKLGVQKGSVEIEARASVSFQAGRLALKSPDRTAKAAGWGGRFPFGKLLGSSCLEAWPIRGCSNVAMVGLSQPVLCP